MKEYGVLLIGCGHIGMEHLSDIYYRDNIRIVAVADTDKERAREASRRAGGALYSTDYRDFLAMDNIDIAIIATYTGSHLEILKECIKAGKHVLCEKPIATDYQSGKEFVEAVKGASVKVLVAHVLRHNLSYITIKKLIDEGAIGDVRLIRMTQNHHALAWDRYKRLMEDCAPTVDCGVHYYDVAEWITGARITEVTGFGTVIEDDSPRENYNLVTFRMDNGCAGYYESGWSRTLRSSNEKEFIGTEGRITLEMRDRRGQDTEEGDLITVYHKSGAVYETRNVRTVYKNMHAQIETLIDMIENGTEGTPRIDDVWRAFRIALTADESTKERTTKKIDF